MILAAHSTGGLITALWQHRRNATGAAAPVSRSLVLNSPWLDLQGGRAARGPLTQALRVLGKVRPFGRLSARPGCYGQTLHVGGTGEWEYDTDLKPLAGFPVTFGWLHAIRRAHAQVHQGLEVGVPVLVLRSARSHFSGHYTPRSSDHADLVLDTTQIGRWAPSSAARSPTSPSRTPATTCSCPVPRTACPGLRGAGRLARRASRGDRLAA